MDQVLIWPSDYVSLYLKTWGAYAAVITGVKVMGYLLINFLVLKFSVYNQPYYVDFV